ncbi:hypothetical protein FA15DRAFT_711606 [Coprinopsis marcescibilis]|uniref:Uncharacterized protein n=1 Tax=Coprinopsis marcescibilis TaxID=230819 RepID=A0A5C3K9S2_COPMA|nr:hypothetical protein FA15DRAFT_711606 [Coprinopsis marcescibilis]
MLHFSNPGCLCTRHITRHQFEPVPPLYNKNDLRLGPVVLVIPFTWEDAANYMKKRHQDITYAHSVGHEIGKEAIHKMMPKLPKPYTRLAVVRDGAFTDVILASNFSEKSLDALLDLDKLEMVRRMMDVDHRPSWNAPYEVYTPWGVKPAQTHTHEMVDWPEYLPKLDKLKTGELRIFEPGDWTLYEYSSVMRAAQTLRLFKRCTGLAASIAIE